MDEGLTDARLDRHHMLVPVSFRCHVNDRLKEKLAACHTDREIISSSVVRCICFHLYRQPWSTESDTSAITTAQASFADPAVNPLPCPETFYVTYAYNQAYKPSLLQVAILLHACLNKPVKDGIVRTEYNDWLLGDNHAWTPTRQIISPATADTTNWVYCA